MQRAHLPERWFAREGGEFVTVEFAVKNYCGGERCCGETGKGGCGGTVVDAEGVVVSEAYCEQADLCENHGRR